MISQVSTNVGALPSFYQRVDNTDKIEVPVPSNISVYAQFKHVRGVPAASNQQPVSLSRAQIIDNMVSYLNNTSEDITLNKDEEFSVGELEQEVHRVINEEKPNFNSLPGVSSDVGVMFNLTA